MEDALTVETHPQSVSPASRRAAWLILLAVLLFTLAMVAVPVWLIRPFSPQTPRGLAIAYALRRWSPYITIFDFGIITTLALLLWRGSHPLRKAVLTLAVVLAFAAMWFSRQNYFEWAFNPLPNAAYARAHEASFIADGDMVLAVEHNGDAVAYPVRLIAYHHIVQDVVGGKPVVSTY